MSRRITPIPSVNSTTSDPAVKQARRERDAWADPSVKVPKESTKNHDQQDKTAKAKPKKAQQLKPTSSSASKLTSAPVPPIKVTPSSSTASTKPKLTATTSTTSTTSPLKQKQKVQIQEGSSGRSHHSHSQNRTGSSSIISSRIVPIVELPDNQVERKPRPQESLVVPTKKSTISSTKGVETAYLAPQGLPAILPTGKHPKAETPKKQIAFATDSEGNLLPAATPGASMVSATSRVSERYDAGSIKIQDASGSTVFQGGEEVLDSDEEEDERGVGEVMEYVETAPQMEVLEPPPPQVDILERQSTSFLDKKEKERLRKVRNLYEGFPVDNDKVILSFHYWKGCSVKNCRYHVTTLFGSKNKKVLSNFKMNFHHPNRRFSDFLKDHNRTILRTLNKRHLLNEKGTAGIKKWLNVYDGSVLGNDLSQSSKKKIIYTGTGSSNQRVTVAPSGSSVARSVAPGSIVAASSRVSSSKAPGSGTLL